MEGRKGGAMINLTKVPYYTIHLSQLLKASEIMKHFKQLGITSNVYGFENLKRGIMKYGVQYDCIAQQPGERTYRQAFHIPGWPSKPSPRSAGNDMLEIIPFFPGITKNDICIHIWDMTNYPRASAIDPKYEVNLLERQLIKEHINKVGYKPIGNIKDESHMDNKLIITDQHFGSLFDYES
jgi:hypothetical protein